MAQKRSIHLPPKNNALKWVLGLAVLGLIIGYGAMFLGKSDVGPIDVSATIKNANATRSTNDTTQEVAPVPEAFANKVNGGLVPADKGSEPTPTPLPETATNTATNTATST